MTAEPTRTPEEIRASFAEKIRAFHAGLPPEEQALLESVFALAAEAAGQSDTTGHIANPNAAPIVGGAAAARFAKFNYYLKAINVPSFLKIEPGN
jgi:hypothetical protein